MNTTEPKPEIAFDPWLEQLRSEVRNALAFRVLLPHGPMRDQHIEWASQVGPDHGPDPERVGAWFVAATIHDAARATHHEAVIEASVALRMFYAQGMIIDRGRPGDPELLSQLGKWRLLAAIASGHLEKMAEQWARFGFDDALDPSVLRAFVARYMRAEQLISETLRERAKGYPSFVQKGAPN